MGYKAEAEIVLKLEIGCRSLNPVSAADQIICSPYGCTCLELIFLEGLRKFFWYRLCLLNFLPLQAAGFSSLAAPSLQICAIRCTADLRSIFGNLSKQKWRADQSFFVFVLSFLVWTSWVIFLVVWIISLLFVCGGLSASEAPIFGDNKLCSPFLQHSS